MRAARTGYRHLACKENVEEDNFLSHNLHEAAALEHEESIFSEREKSTVLLKRVLLLHEEACKLRHLKLLLHHVKPTTKIVNAENKVLGTVKYAEKLADQS